MLSVCNISSSHLLKAVFKAEKQELTPSLHLRCAGVSFCKDAWNSPSLDKNSPQRHSSKGKPILCHHVITELTLAHTKLQQIHSSKGLTCSQKYCLWWRAIKLCNNLPREISEIFSSESSPSRSWNGESLWNELLVSGMEKTTNTPPHTRTPKAK